MKNRWVGLGDFEKVEVELFENGVVSICYDWDGGAHNPNWTRMTAREFLKNVPTEVNRLLSVTDFHELINEVNKNAL